MTHSLATLGLALRSPCPLGTNDMLLRCCMQRWCASDVCIHCINEDVKFHVSHQILSQAWAAQLKWCAKTFAQTEQ